MQEPIDSIDVDLWLIYADYLSDHDDVAGEARARRIAATLASGRTGLWLEYQTDRFVKLSKLHFPNPTSGLGPSFVSTYRWLASCPRGQFPDCQAISPLLYPDHFCSRPDVARLFFDKLAELGPFLWLPADNVTVAVPREVAVCPECGGALKGTITVFVEPAGEPRACPVYCEDDLKTWNECRMVHFKSLPAWQPVRDQVERWARDHVRVKAEETVKPWK